MPIIIDGATVFGNYGYNILLDFEIALMADKLVLKGVTANGDTTYRTDFGFYSEGVMVLLAMDDCDFGTASGIKIGHGAGDIFLTGAPCFIDLNNTKLSSETDFVWDSANWDDTGKFITIRTTDHNQVAGTAKSWFKNGTIETDTVVYKTASPSMKMSPDTVVVSVHYE